MKNVEKNQQAEETCDNCRFFEYSLRYSPLDIKEVLRAQGHCDFYKTELNVSVHGCPNFERRVQCVPSK